MVETATPKFIWMDGRLVKWENAKVHVMTHALHYGDAVFEGIRSYSAGKGAALFRLDEHLERLFYSAGSLHLNTKFTKEELKNTIKKLVKANKLMDCYVRPLIYRGYGSLGVYPNDAPANLVIIAVPWKKYYSNNLSVSTSAYSRYPENSTVFGAKISGNYVNSILAMSEARKNGYDEALMLDADGFVSEGPAENLFLVSKESVITPNSRSALHGITRKSLIRIAKDIGLEVCERSVKLSEVINADELFFCGTAIEIAPIISVNGKKIGNGKVGKITSKLRDNYYNIVRGKDKRYVKWLDYI